MASSMIHLAITQCLIPEIGCGDDFRLRLGAILPDGAIQGNAHLKKQVGENRITYDLEFFRRRYRAQMETDGLYLGYYLHLIQDIFYRNFLYTQRHWDPTPPGNVERLHRDYGILNGYVAQKFHLYPEMLRSIPIAREPIAELAVFTGRDLSGKSGSNLPTPPKENRSFSPGRWRICISQAPLPYAAGSFRVCKPEPVWTAWIGAGQGTSSPRRNWENKAVFIPFRRIYQSYSVRFLI